MIQMDKKKILIVEDEPAMRDIMNDRLIEEGFEVILATNGAEGLEAALKEHPDLILLDIIMPKMDGITMLKKLREDKWGKSAQIIILSNLSTEGAVADSIKNSVFEYLIKTDWRLSDLIKMVKKKLSGTV